MSLNINELIKLSTVAVERDIAIEAKQAELDTARLTRQFTKSLYADLAAEQAAKRACDPIKAVTHKTNAINEAYKSVGLKLTGSTAKELQDAVQAACKSVLEDIIGHQVDAVETEVSAD